MLPGYSKEKVGDYIWCLGTFAEMRDPFNRQKECTFPENNDVAEDLVKSQ